MPSYSQLQAESWWDREVTTTEIAWLGAELCRRTGRPRAAFGNKGDNNHLRGAHRSQEWILNSRYATSRTYTVQSGLTAIQQRHVAGVDFTPGSSSQMIAQCKRIYAAMRAGQLDEVREFYGNVDGDKVVDGWDNVRDRAASSDSSHLWHWHLGLDRRHCADRHLMERILAVALGDPMEDDMPTVSEIWGAGFGRGADRVEAGQMLAQARSAAIEANSKADAILRAVSGQTGDEIIAEIRADGDRTRAALTALISGLAPELAPALAALVADRLGVEIDQTEIGESIAHELAELLAAAAQVRAG